MIEFAPIMPQKMNPDIAEKIKSKSAKLIANLNHVLIAMKGTPSGYNRDSAESKIAIMASLEETLSTISIANDMLTKIMPNPEAMKKGIVSSLPTKLADELVKKFHIPFRTAHKIVGKTVSLVQGDIKNINPETIETAIQEITGKTMSIDQKLIDDVFNIDNALKQYQHAGSAGPKYVYTVNNKLKKEVKTLSIWVNIHKNKCMEVEQDLFNEVDKFING